jgi:hypothetical protein
MRENHYVTTRSISMAKKGTEPHNKRKDIDGDQVRMLASFGCTILDIAKYFQVSESVIRKRFRADYEGGLEDVKLKLRQNLLKMSLVEKNTACTIFLAKNYLGMSDKTAVDLTGNLEALLKECGFEDNPLDQANTEQAKAMESLGVSTDPTTKASA